MFVLSNHIIWDNSSLRNAVKEQLIHYLDLMNCSKTSPLMRKLI